MNKIISIINDITDSPSLIWLIGTIIATICILISLGVKIATIILGIWIFGTVIIYFMKNG